MPPAIVAQSAVALVRVRLASLGAGTSTVVRTYKVLPRQAGAPIIATAPAVAATPTTRRRSSPHEGSASELTRLHQSPSHQIGEQIR